MHLIISSQCAQSLFHFAVAHLLLFININILDYNAKCWKCSHTSLLWKLGLLSAVALPFVHWLNVFFFQYLHLVKRTACLCNKRRTAGGAQCVKQHLCREMKVSKFWIEILQQPDLLRFACCSHFLAAESTFCTLFFHHAFSDLITNQEARELVQEGTATAGLNQR